MPELLAHLSLFERTQPDEARELAASQALAGLTEERRVVLCYPQRIEAPIQFHALKLRRHDRAQIAQRHPDAVRGQPEWVGLVSPGAHDGDAKIGKELRVGRAFLGGRQVSVAEAAV